MTNAQFLTQFNVVERILFAYALRLTKTYEDAEDLMQETRLRAYKHRDRFAVGTNFKGWTTTIMRNAYINRYRKMKNRRHVSAPVEDYLYAVENKAAVCNGGEAKMNMDALKGKLMAISHIYRVPFLMFYQGYEYSEIAAHLGIPIGTVKSRIFLARKRLKKLIGPRPVAA